MYESPQSLQEVCLDYICENIDELCVDPNDNSDTAAVNVFGSTDLYFPHNIAEQLLEILSKKLKLTDKTLLIFSHDISSLRTVIIHNASKITTKGLRTLNQHKIIKLEVQYLSEISVNDLIGCLGEWTLHNLQHLNVSNCTFGKNDQICVFVALSKLKTLRTLNVSGTEFNLNGLDIVTQDLPLLENLNISQTMIRDISPLKRCKDHLKILNMYNLRIINNGDYISVLNELKNICHLDISVDVDDQFVGSLDRSEAALLLKTPTCLPHLISLDLSGKDGINITALREFLENHPTMKFLGLMFCEICFNDMFTKEDDEHYNANLVVSGCANENQVLESLRRYVPRKAYIQKALYVLYTHTQHFQKSRIDVIELVLAGMKEHSNVLTLMLAGTACLYNLSRSPVGAALHPHWLKRIVEMAVTAMSNFPRHQQLQRNALLTLCSDRILQEVTFDRFRCAELVMEALVAFDDPSMNRMSVAICSILAAKISTRQTSALGGIPTYMGRLLDIVNSKTAHEEVDIMMKFTLSALWNLTDESPATCTVFLNMGGMELFLKVLNRFSGESAIETKVLGLVNNIAEVWHLRPYLMKDDLLQTLRSLLYSQHVDVSYFAAGILAHLGSDDSNAWSDSTYSRDDILSELADAVLSWKTPETEMVAYRSFAPFFPLLNFGNEYAVQLWAVWAIHHVCSKNPRRYCPMLVEEGGLQLLEDLLTKQNLDSSVAEFCSRIIDLFKQPFS